ncbi:MAG: 3'-5' exoribonuclease [Burkholderiaceae bacterium]|nr:3'-5' exoribonuclease [Burkholderiaceae bacterium]
MKLRLRLALALLALCTTVLAAVLAVAAAAWFDLDAAERATASALLQTRAVALLVVLLLVVAATAIAFAPVLRRLFGGPAKLAQEARILLDAHRAHRVPTSGDAELGAIARTLNALADQRDALAGDVQRQVRESQATLEEERNRLAALVSELAQGIVACNLDGRVLLYNNRARLLFAALAPGTPIGLGRSIYGVIEQPLIDHALGNVRLRLADGSQRALATFVTAGRSGQLMRVQMVPVPAAQGETAAAPSGGSAAAAPSGYVLLLENVTRSVEAESRRDQALHALTEGSRAALANLRAAVETLAAYPDMEPAQRERFVGVIAQEVQLMSARLDAHSARQADALKARWVLEDMRGADLLAAARQAIEARAGLTVHDDAVTTDLWVRADSFTLIRALAWLAARLHDEFGIRALRMRLTPAQRLTQLDLAWPVSAAPPEALQGWEHEPMPLGDAPGPLTLHDVAERHGTEVWFQRDEALTCCRLLLPPAEPEDLMSRDATVAPRPEYYDFALLERAREAHALDEQPLAELTYTVFDTETTGLDPTRDEIIQIGAVRIVNLRLLRGETFDQLVDPQRRLDAASTRVHGIGPDMLRGQPTIDEVLPAFHAFCADAVLVGHNAAFDMRFLQCKETATGVRFQQPLLDTLLLSEVLHPALDSHALEAIAERLGVRIEARHNALGDAIITAEVFLRMVRLLNDMGIRTLRQAREAAAKTRYARVQY